MALYYRANVYDGSIKLLSKKEALILSKKPLHANCLITYTNDEDDVDEWISRSNCLNHKFLGFDLEWKPCTQRGEYSPTSVLQLCCGNQVLIFQTRGVFINRGMKKIFHKKHFMSLKLLDILKNENVIKVGVGIINDAKKLAADFNVLVQPVLDLSVPAKLHYKNCLKRVMSKNILENMEKYASIIYSKPSADCLREKLNFPLIEFRDISRFLCASDKTAPYQLDLKSIQSFLEHLSQYNIKKLRSFISDPKNSAHQLQSLPVNLSHKTTVFPIPPSNQKFGIKSLLERYFGIKSLGDRISRSDWSKCPLSENQILYAAIDGWVGFAIANELDERLNCGLEMLVDVSGNKKPKIDDDADQSMQRQPIKKYHDLPNIPSIKWIVDNRF